MCVARTIISRREENPSQVEEGNNLGSGIWVPGSTTGVTTVPTPPPILYMLQESISGTSRYLKVVTGENGFVTGNFR